MSGQYQNTKNPFTEIFGDFFKDVKNDTDISNDEQFIETISNIDMQDFLVWLYHEKNMSFSGYGAGFFENREIQKLFNEFISTKKAS
jgi:hypothetical protein